MKTILSPVIYIMLILIAIGCDSSYTDKGITGDHSSGKGGSLARFTIAQNSLFTVTPNYLKRFDLTQPSLPEYADSSYLGFGIETIFPYGNNLFIGTQTGMQIFDISNPSLLIKLSTYQHIYSCDPVVAEGNYAYVTLNSNNSWCGRFTNQLEIVDISNLYNPKRIKEYPMNGPLGLGVDGNLLFICDNGLKVYDITNKLNIQLKQHFSIKATDVIPIGNRLLVTGDDGLYQYSYDGAELTLLSKIPVETE